MGDTTTRAPGDHAPLKDLDDLDAARKARYAAAEGGVAGAFTDPNKPQDAFRDYAAEARSSVREFYRLNHRYQTLDFVWQKKGEYLPKTKRQMGIWEAM